MTQTIFENEFIRQGILFGNETSGPLPLGAMEDVQAVVRELLTRMKQAELAKKASVSQGTISKWLSGAQSPNKRQWDAVLAIFPARRENIVGVKGLVGAGGAVDTGAEQLPADGNLYEIEVPFPLPDRAFALQVSGESMFPRYDPGDIIVCARWSDDPHLLLGWEAAVQTIDGSRYLKRLIEGGRKGVFDLESFNAATIRGVRLRWASSIHSVVRAGQWRRLDSAKRGRALQRAASS